MQLSLAKFTPALKCYYSRNSQQKKIFAKNALSIMQLSIMLKGSLKLINHSLVFMTGEILQGGTKPIKKPIFFSSKFVKIWNLQICSLDLENVLAL